MQGLIHFFVFKLLVITLASQIHKILFLIQSSQIQSSHPTLLTFVPSFVRVWWLSQNSWKLKKPLDQICLPQNSTMRKKISKMFFEKAEHSAFILSALHRWPLYWMLVNSTLFFLTASLGKVYATVPIIDCGLYGQNL